MMRAITIDATSHLTGIYSEDSPSIPTDAITLSDAEAALLHGASSLGDWLYSGGVLSLDTVGVATREFNDAMTAELLAVDTFHANAVQMLAGNPTQVEKDSWAMKLSTAHAVSSGATVSAEGLAFMSMLGLIAPTGATPAETAAADAAKAAWVAKVQANAARYAGLVGIADALRSQAKAAISSAKDMASLKASVAANRAAADAAIAAFPKG